ncbi:hypothetical protein A2U01_0070589, partial [Trifolium medium]|nr:hypothetical protein [Trifolium medium]
DSYIGHPFVITTLCIRLQVPTEDDDDIASPVEPLGRIFFQREQRDLQAAQAAAEAAAAAPPPPPPPPPPHQQQHQVPPHICQQHQYSDYELGMAASFSEQH